MFNNVLDRKETFVGHKIFNLASLKNRILLKGLTHALVKKCTFFINLFLVKIRLEIMFNIVLDRKGTFSGHEEFSL